MDKSRGHVMFLNNYEYFKAPDGTLYRAKTSNYISIDGYRVGARFECVASSVIRHVKYLLTFNGGMRDVR